MVIEIGGNGISAAKCMIAARGSTKRTLDSCAFPVSMSVSHQGIPQLTSRCVEFRDFVRWTR